MQRTPDPTTPSVDATALRLALDMGGLGVWIYTVEDNRLLIDDYFGEVFGLAQRVLTPEDVDPRVHPEDFERYMAARAAALDPAGEGKFGEVHRVRRPDGEVRWVEGRGQVLFDGTGEARTPLRVVGIVRDITELKAAQAQLTYDRNRLGQELDVHAEELRVSNEELRTSNEELRGLLEEREHMVREVQRMSLRLSERRERERLAVARELHDDVIQDLAALNISLKNDYRDWLKANPDAAKLERLTHYSDLTLGAVSKLRRVIRGLRPVGLGDYGLRDLLENYLSYLRDEIAAADGLSPELELDVAAYDGDPPEQVTLCLFRVAQETLRNALKHAKATRITIRLEVAREAKLSVSDDGLGFVPQERDDLIANDHFGLINIGEYVSGLGGRLAIESASKQGTTVAVELPLEETRA